MKKKLLNTFIKVAGYLYKTFINKAATHSFYYSQKQDNLPIFDSLSFGSNPSVPLFKNQLYSEMSEFKNGWSNWDDAKLLGFGSVNDVTFK